MFEIMSKWIAQPPASVLQNKSSEKSMQNWQQEQVFYRTRPSDSFGMSEG